MSRNPGIRVLLIGGSGFVGERLASHFYGNRKYEVALYDLNPSTNLRMIDSIKLFIGDIMSFDNLVACINNFKPTVVIHLASSGMSGSGRNNLFFLVF